MAPPRLTVLAFALLCAFGGGALANPTGANVVAGKADVSTSGKTLTVTNAPGTIINWQGFSIAPDELTRFIQQSATSAVLNRVIGQDPSSLLGRLQSNGRVFLINPNGIVFGAGARIDVGGLVASTLDIGDADFLAGRLNFAGPASAGALAQLGQITTAERRPGAADRAADREQRRHHLAEGRDPARRRPQRAARRHRQSGACG